MAIKFDNRIDVARLLANHHGRNPLVLANPRDAVGIGRVFADEPGGELDVALVRKLRSSLNPEYAVAAVDESGWIYLADDAARSGVDADSLECKKQRQMDTLRWRRPQCAPADFQAAGRFHRDFPQVQDGEVTALLARRGESRP